MSAALEFPNDRLMETALEIAARRKDTLLRLKTAIRNHDLDTADQLVTELVPDDGKAKHRTVRQARRGDHGR